MKKQIDVKAIVDEYKKIGPLAEKTLWSGDYKAGNRYAARMLKLYKLFENDLSAARSIVSELMNNSDSTYLKIIGATYSLVLGIFVDDASNILQEIEQNSDNALCKLNAEYTLKEWRNGTLVVYHKK